MNNGFSVNDSVTFECATGTSAPRWDFNDDAGASNMWATGRIFQINELYIFVEYTIEGMIGTGHCAFPNVSHPDYNPEQWAWAGYLRKTENLRIQKCECGGEKCRTPHSSWCPAYIQ